MFPDDKDHTHDTPEAPDEETQSDAKPASFDLPVEETAQPVEDVAAGPVAADAGSPDSSIITQQSSIEGAEPSAATGAAATEAASPDSSTINPQSSIEGAEPSAATGAAATPDSSFIVHRSSLPAAENLTQLESSIRALDAGHLENGKRNYKSFWDAAKQVGALFKTLKPLPYDDRERLWMEFSALCDDVRAQQTHEKEELKYSSHELRAELETKIAAVREQAQAATKATEFNTVTSELAKIRNDFTAKQGVEPNMLARDREALWKIWKAADDEVWSRRSELRKQNYDQGKLHYTQLLEMAEHGDPVECHKKIKDLRPWQREVELSREQREEIRKQLDLAWDNAAARIQGQRADRQKHFEEWSEKAEGLLEEWQNKIEKMREFRGRLLEQIERLNEMETNARTDEFADQVAGWKTDKQQKLDHVADTIAQLEQKIESVKKRLKK